MSTISAYTTVTNAIKNEYPIEESLRSVLMFADEVMVVDGGSNDGTLELIASINDSRIKVYHTEWLDTIGNGIYGITRSMGIGRCTSDWCVLFDADEVYHENDIEKIKRIPLHMGEEIMAVKFNVLHFYQDYNHILNGYAEWKDLYTNKIYMVRNHMGIHHGNINGDPDNFLQCNGQPIPDSWTVLLDIIVYHYGHVKSPNVWLEKKNRMHKQWHPYHVLDFKDPYPIPLESLKVFEGKHPGVMKNRMEIRNGN